MNAFIEFMTLQVFFNKGEINTVLNLHFSANMLPGGLSLYPERH